VRLYGIYRFSLANHYKTNASIRIDFETLLLQGNIIMASEKRFSLLRRILRAFGLAPAAVEDIVTGVGDLLAGEGDTAQAQAIEFPYQLRDNFLSAAELSFYGVLKDAVNGRAAISSKVGLNDLFYVKMDDQSRFRVYTNKIDRKHVDFLICDSTTMRPLVGIELDDKSHQRADRQARDEFVDQVFKAAGLPILHIPAKRGYVFAEISFQIAPFLGVTATPSVAAPSVVAAKVASPVAATAPVPTETPVKTVASASQTDAPTCPKCGSAMILRTAKTGANAGNQFWGCSKYPACKSMLPYNA
jgi:predicted RNA-binding Zn-ribbon protein involved in translation (DUF1610 family)